MPDSGQPVLTALGASPDEDRVYRYLATTTSASAEDVAMGTSLPARVVADALTALEARGLVSRMTGQAIRFVAANPTAVEQLLTETQQRVQQELSAAWTALADITTEYHARKRERDVGELIEIVRGREALALHARRTQENARKEVLGMMRPPIVAFHFDEAISAHARRGVTTKLVYDTRMVADPATLEAIAAAQQPGEHNRVLTDVPVKLIIVDRSEAMLNLGRGDDPSLTAMIVHGGGVLDALIALFEYVWSVATPLHSATPGQAVENHSPLTADDRQLISLILAGLTDDAIAVRLGVSRRTAQRRIRALEDAVRAKTRMELLWLVASRGWMT
jgi:sugar-specific transcriptional regulator TrmB/DNA-binding CsgD family transcriptional regulator